MWETVGVLRIALVLKKYKQFLFLGGGFAFLTTLITLAMPNTYQSEARLLAMGSSQGSGLGQIAAAAATFGLSIPGQDGGEGNFTDVLASRWMAESLLGTTFDFKERSWAFGRAKSRQMTLENYLGTRNRDLAVGKLRKILTSKRDPKTKLLVITAETNSPELSQGIVREACDLLEKFLLVKSNSRGRLKVAFAEKRLIEARQEAQEAEAAFRRFLDGNRNFTGSADPSVRLTGSRLEADVRLRQQLLATLTINREQALLEEKNDIPVLTVMDAGNLPLLKSGPPRSLIVAFSFFGSLALLFLWNKRDWFMRILSEH